MFKNIGRTLCIIGQILFWLFLASGVISFLAAMAGEDYMLIFVPTGIVSAFLFAMPIYGFGKLIQDVKALREEIVKDK